ncbi:MAG TPA: type 1 glutamine amidotransferase [Usitatibacter sp.]|nr:type 1 glutamine amidotransferase [Usitatibacter sp.]
MEPLRIGISSRLLYPDPARVFLPTKSVQYLEQSVTSWLMSGDVLAFMIPAMSLASTHRPRTLKPKHYVDALDGLLLQGGADMSPASYGETPLNPLWTGDEVRDRYEIELFREFVAQGKPVLGVCRGHQLLNVALGGSLYQDIATQCPGKASHRDETRYEAHFHDMRIRPGGWLARLFPGVTVTRVNTIHHQAIRRLGEGLIVEATSEPDGVIEAVRWEGRSFVAGVQWHPEFMDPDDPALIDSKPLLRAFVAASELRKKTGKPSPAMTFHAA